MALPPVEQKEELIIPEIQDSGIPVRKRFFNLLILTFQAAFVMVVMYLSGMVLCSLFARLLGLCVC